MILAFIETRALSIFNNIHFLDMSESMVTMIMSRNLEVSFFHINVYLFILQNISIVYSLLKVPEIHKFEAMLKWAKNHIRKQSYSNKVEAKIDFRACMERLSRDLKLYKISPNDLIKEKIVILLLPIFTIFFPVFGMKYYKNLNELQPAAPRLFYRAKLSRMSEYWRH